MALTEQEMIRRRVEDFHEALRGRRRAYFWPDVPKSQVNLGVCEFPLQHEFEPLETLKPVGRKYHLDVALCKHCPLSLVTPVLPKDKPGK